MNTAQQTRNATILNARGHFDDGRCRGLEPPGAAGSDSTAPITEREEPHIEIPLGCLYWRRAQSEHSKSNMAKRAIEVTRLLCLGLGLVLCSATRDVGAQEATPPRTPPVAAGHVLLAGGSILHLPAVQQSAQLYDTVTNTLAPRSRIATMNRPRAGHSATLLNDGKVLIAGGESLGGGLDCGATTSTELYDQTTRSFAAPATTATMNAGRTGAPAISLSNGKVLIVGGVGCDPLASTELYDPLTNTFASPTETAVMNHARAGATATSITRGPASGKVLIAGGAPEALDTMNLIATELYDPASNSFAPPDQTADMSEFRLEPASIELNDGKILIVGGGYSYALGWDASTELYDEATNTFEPPSNAPSMNAARIGPAAVPLTTGPNSGKVLIIGGSESLGGTPLASTELYDPATNSFAPPSATATMKIARQNLVATTLSNGTVLVYGSPDSAGNAVLSLELYDPTTNAFRLGPNLGAARSGATMTLLQ